VNDDPAAITVVNHVEPVPRRGAIGHDELLVHNWRVWQLTRLGIPGPLAEVYADRIAWHQVAPADATRLPGPARAAHRPMTPTTGR
jgi:hypothetical protein